MPALDAVPDLLGRLGKPEQIPVFQVNDSFIDQEIDIDGATPKRFAYEYDRYRLYLSRLYEVRTSNNSSNVP